MMEDRESRRSFSVWMKKRGLTGVRLIIGDKNPGMPETIPEVFPDGQSALMPVCAGLRHVAGTQWGSRRYMNMDHPARPENERLSDNIAG